MGRLACRANEPLVTCKPFSSMETSQAMSKLRQTVLILRHVRPRCGSWREAVIWFVWAQLPGFGGASARRLVNQGRAADVLEYLDAVDAGIFA